MTEKKICILIVDDDDYDRLLLERNLKRANIDFEIYCKSDPIQAAFFFKTRVPDVVLADVNYNGFDASALEALIRVAEKNQRPIIVHSNAEWEKPITARGIYFRPKGDFSSKEYYSELSKFIHEVHKKNAKVEISGFEINRLTRPDWHTAGAKRKLQLLLARPELTKDEREVLWLRLELLNAYDDLKIDKLQGLPQKEIDTRLDYALRILSILEKRAKETRVSINRSQLAKRDRYEPRRPI